MKEVKITDIKGIKVGHAQNLEGGSGTTVILCEEGMLASCEVRGGGPASVETELLDPVKGNQGIHAVMLSGGSAYGLAARGGIMRYLEERGKGKNMRMGVVPIVPGACIFDLPIGDWNFRPGEEMGYQACLNATDGPVAEGNVGAGTGAVLGKMQGRESAMKGGLGHYALQVGDVIVGAIVAVNAVGDVWDPETGKIVAGALSEDRKSFRGLESLLEKFLIPAGGEGENTTIGCVVTNAKLTKAQCKKVAEVAHNGFARSIRPVHTFRDGDCIFSVTSNEVEVTDVDAVAALAAKVMERAVISAAKHAEPAYGLSAYKEFDWID